MRVGMRVAATAAATRHWGEARSATSNRAWRTARMAWRNGAIYRDSRPARIRQEIEDSLAQDRVLATLSGLFGLLALLLASVGLYGTTAYTIGRRRSDFLGGLTLPEEELDDAEAKHEKAAKDSRGHGAWTLTETAFAHGESV